MVLKNLDLSCITTSTLPSQFSTVFYFLTSKNEPRYFETIIILNNNSYSQISLSNNLDSYDLKCTIIYKYRHKYSLINKNRIESHLRILIKNCCKIPCYLPVVINTN